MYALTIRSLGVALMLSVVAHETPAVAQRALHDEEFGGPRFGVTMVGGTSADRLRDEFDIAPLITQFGWQFETRLFTAAEGELTAVTEWIPLIGGLEQGGFVPSISWLVGLRSARGAEFAVGPNLSPAGAALAFAAGFSQKLGEISIPMNLAVVPGGNGVRVSMLTGFYVRR